MNRLKDQIRYAGILFLMAAIPLGRWFITDLWRHNSMTSCVLDGVLFFLSLILATGCIFFYYTFSKDGVK